MGNSRKDSVWSLLFLLGGILLLTWTGFRIYKSVTFDIAIEDRLKRAADANQTFLALEEVNAALEGMDVWGLCPDKGPDCYTSILYRTPDEDVAFWRKNLEQAKQDLEELPPDADHLTVSNTLMKLRESILDNGSDGVSVTVPEGASVYPYNVLVMLWGLVGLILVCICPYFLKEE